MVRKMDYSISRVLKKEKVMNDWNDIRTEEKDKGSCKPTHEEEKLIRSLPNRNKNRESLFFEEITKNIWKRNQISEIDSKNLSTIERKLSFFSNFVENLPNYWLYWNTK